MSESIINKITLDFLINKEYQNYLLKNKNLCQSINNINKKDQKFYKKRIYNLTRLLLTDSEENIPSDIKYAFNNYMKLCINNFKVIDNNDIIQEDYKNITQDLLNELVDKIDENNIKKEKEESDKLLMRKINTTEYSLDKFIKRTIIKTDSDKMFIPKQKEINLQDPVLRNKGILISAKKENVNNII
jgi:hypothetical protein